jgi:NAD(P)-dependent dehydrogenase (short-subunit alcohol dehydrogenase family)
MQTNIPHQLNAVVVGASGGLGAAFTAALASRPDVGRVFALSRRQLPSGSRIEALTVDAGDPESYARALQQAADEVRSRAPAIHLLITCTGMLHDAGATPEKSLRQLDAASFQRVMTVNALVPLQVLAAFAPLLRHGERSVAATLSAMVGSIGDNRLGGWYSYRMSKAALNMGLKTASIELGRAAGSASAPTGPIVVALHPGTTVTSLSTPYLQRREARPAGESVRHLLAVLDRLTPADNGKFLNWDGRELPW